ncbi:TLC domain-containing protein 2 isoform X2 [Malaclemys terrapin pileata]|uniref:TLC domain-containing protein 2 isoform X2 n=1 Tax=Malaclemys terrapin pileata TaxID=2991368 RepID=UPI0023A82D63|nr:TLC domain-containing protein 2 isoform X2 [Malaclemys terrapin pileata]
MGLSPGLLLVGGSFAAFRLLNRGLERLVPPPRAALRNRWKWRNIWTSFVHSLLSGAGALLGFYLHPQMAEDLIGTHSPAARSVVSVSIGYFLQDFVDMLCNQKLHQSWELLFHHSVILLMANLVHTTCYRLNSIINLGTYVVFRITTLAWMTRWLVLNRENIPLATYTVGTVGMAIMTPMNIILFYRLLRSDFLKSSREVWREKEK